MSFHTWKLQEAIEELKKEKTCKGVFNNEDYWDKDLKSVCDKEHFEDSWELEHEAQPYSPVVLAVPKNNKICAGILLASRNVTAKQRESRRCKQCPKTKQKFHFRHTQCLQPSCCTHYCNITFHFSRFSWPKVVLMSLVNTVRTLGRTTNIWYNTFSVLLATHG